MIDNVYRVALFGHRIFDGHKVLDTRLFDILADLMKDKPFVEIYIGRNGEFDLYAASVVKRVQRSVSCDNNELICVLPYASKSIEYLDNYYDSIRVYEMMDIHPKRAITERNRRMVEMCDLVICYVEKERGGAYQAMKYAQKLNKKTINLAEC